MATIPSRSLPSEVKLCKKACKSCGLNIYQGPALEPVKKAHVFWVGLSAVVFDEGEEKLPLSPLTPSGSLIHAIEAPLRKQISFYKTNLVKCAPLQEGKIRYPLRYEMEKCFPNFEWELEYLRPQTVFLLGRQVADFVMRNFGLQKAAFNQNFRYRTFIVDGTRFVPIHHPSYMLVYNHSQVERYKRGLQALILKTSSPDGKQQHARVKQPVLI